MEIGRDMVKVPGRQVPEEKVFMRSRPLKQEKAEWSRDMRGKQLDVCVKMSNWIIVYSTRNTQVVNGFISNLQKVSRGLGIDVHQPLQYVEVMLL